MAGRRKGKIPTPVEICGGKQCGACKGCCDELRAININDEVRELSSQNKEAMSKVRAENKGLKATQVV